MPWWSGCHMCVRWLSRPVSRLTSFGCQRRENLLSSLKSWLKSPPAAFVGRVTAKDQAAAIAAAIELYGVLEWHQKRLLALRRAA